MTRTPKPPRETRRDVWVSGVISGSLLILAIYALLTLLNIAWRSQ